MHDQRLGKLIFAHNELRKQEMTNPLPTEGAKEGIVVDRADTEDDAVKVTDSLPQLDEDHTGDADPPQDER